MAEWEDWNYIAGAKHLKDYEVGSQVTFLTQKGTEYGVFKEYKGIISHCYSRLAGNRYYHCSVQAKGLKDIMLIYLWKDANPQIIIETLEEHMNFSNKMTGKI